MASSMDRIWRIAENGSVAAAASLAGKVSRVATARCDVNFRVFVGITVSTGKFHAADTDSIL